MIVKSWSMPPRQPSVDDGYPSIVRMFWERLTHIVDRHVRAAPEEPWGEWLRDTVRTALCKTSRESVLTCPAAAAFFLELERECRRSVEHPLYLSYTTRFKNPGPKQKMRPVRGWLFLLEPGLILIAHEEQNPPSQRHGPEAYVVTAYFPKPATKQTRKEDRQRKVAQRFVERYQRAGRGNLPHRLPSLEQEFEVEDDDPVGKARRLRIHSHIEFHQPETWGFDENQAWRINLLKPIAPHVATSTSDRQANPPMTPVRKLTLKPASTFTSHKGETSHDG
jgi:hypothetical protein